jgi:uncharacterized protein YecE (DUF72 family)
MGTDKSSDPEQFQFRDLHPQVSIGTASDRYSGWIGQIYSEGRYTKRITRRTHTVGGKSFSEEVLPVDSLEEYFEHFSVLEIDYTFYRPLLEQDGFPTQNHRVLQRYIEYLKERDHLIIKVPQLIFAQKIRQGKNSTENEAYLNAEIFTKQFYEPAVKLLGPKLTGLIFEQEYQRKKDRTPLQEMAKSLDEFFEKIPKDNRYHIELRTETYLSTPVFEVLEKQGVGLVLSHWTWLPPLSKQFARSGKRFFNSGGACVVRLMTPIGMKYEEAYARAHPFDKLVNGMLQPQMVEDTTQLMVNGVERGVRMNIIVNNRAGGNAPLIARQIAERFLVTQAK